MRGLHSGFLIQMYTKCESHGKGNMESGDGKLRTLNLELRTWVGWLYGQMVEWLYGCKRPGTLNLELWPLRFTFEALTEL